MADASPKPSETERIRGRWNARDAAKAIKKAGRKRPSTRPAGKGKLAEGDLGHHGRGVNQGGFHNRQNDDREPAQSGQDEESHAVNTSLL